MIDLTGKRAFVTGGGRGIGRATALLLARKFAHLQVSRVRRRFPIDVPRALQRLIGPDTVKIVTLPAIERLESA